MKKVLIAVLIISAFLSSCKKEDKSAFDKSPDERLNETLAAYQTQLSGAQNGWKAFIQVDSGKGATYGFYFKFNDANRVTMLSDFDSLSAVTPKESSYRLKALQQPSLVFDTYSYLHVLSDPDPNVNGQNFGSGLLADFEFYFDSSTADVIKLVGRIYGSKLILIRATQAEEDAYNNGALASGLFINKILTYFKRLTIGSQFYDIRIDPVKRQVIFSWADASGAFVSFSTGYYSTAGGIGFTNPLINGSQTISGFDNITWNQGAQTLSVTIGGTAATITGVVKPLKVDLNAPLRWWQEAANSPGGYWISINGFHVNGVDDAFNVNTLASGNSRYYYYIYYPNFGPTNDLFAPIFLDVAGNQLVLDYGTAPRTPVFTADGRAVFLLLGDYPPYPTSGPAVESKNLLYQSSGYYFVQTGTTSYDMVSAADGKAWISWRY